MKKTLLILQCLLLTSFGFAQEYYGTTTIGTGGPEIPFHSTKDSNGDILSTGLYSGTMTFGSETITWAGGNADGFLTKYGSDGTPLWIKGFGGGFDDVAVDVATDGANNIYLTGYFQGAGSQSFDADPGPGVFQLMQQSPFLSRDCFIIKLDSNGDFVWAKQVSNPFGGAANEDSQAIAVDGAGNVYIGGSFILADFDPGPGTNTIFSTGGAASLDGFLLKLDTNGNFVYVKTFGATDLVEVEDISFDSNEDLLITGRFRNTVDLDPNAGTANFTSNGGDDIFMAKLDSDGNYIWGQAFGGTGLDIVSKIEELPSGIYVEGMFSDSVDLDPTAGDNTVVSNGPWDAFVSKFDTTGAYEFSYVLGGDGPEFENFYDIEEGYNGNVFFTGAFNSTTDFDNSANDASTTSNGSTDNFLLELTPTGDYVNHWSVGGTDKEAYPQIFFNDNDEVLSVGSFRGANVDLNPFAGEDLHASNGFDDSYFSHYKLFSNANDACSNAIAVACGDSVTGETSNDTDSGGNAAPDEFFSFTGTGIPELVTISLCGGGTDYDSLLRVFEDCTLANELAFNDDSCGLQSELTFLSDGVSTYYIMVEGFGSASGNFSLDVSCDALAANDECLNAEAISCGDVVAGSTNFATIDGAAPDCGVGITSPGVWYTFSDTTGLLTNYSVDLCDGTTTFDSKISVWTGDDCGTLTCIGDNDDDCGLQSSVSWQSADVATYFILVHGFGGATGDFALTLSCEGVPPPNDMIANSIDVDEIGFPYTDPNVAMPFATTEAGSPVDCDNAGALGVWYNFIPLGNGTATATIVTPAGPSSVTFYTAPSESAVETDLVHVDYFLNQCVDSTEATILTTAGQAYYVYVYNHGGASDIVIDGENLGTNNTVFDGFAIYPNPTQDILTVKSVVPMETAELYNILGQRVMQFDIQATEKVLNISELSAGTYILNVLVDEQIGTYKVIKQ